MESCTPVSIADNKRILVQGRILDNNGQPLENIRVRTTTSVNRFLNRSLETLSEDISDQDGEISFISLDVDAGNICLEISGDSQSENYESVTICDSDYSRDNSKFNLGDFQLKRVVDIALVTNLQQDLNFNLKYRATDSYFVIENWDDLEQYDTLSGADNIREISGTLESMNSRDTIYLRTLLNSNITLQINYPEGQEIYEFLIDEEDAIYEIDL